MIALHPKHLQEWLASGVDEALIRLNVKSLETEDSILSHLVYALPSSERRNDGRLRDKWLKRYGGLKSGWWVSGLQPISWQPMQWGRFKPDNPREAWDAEKQCPAGKAVKYESPSGTSNRVTYLRVPLSIWQQVASRYGVAMPEEVTISPDGEAIGFWQWAQDNPSIPVILTEGEKKGACLLSLGFAAVALPGIWGGRVGKPDAEKLHSDLMPIATNGRTIIVLFDYESNPKTKRQVSHAIRRTGQAIIQQGCECEVAVLPGPEKGVDDWAVAQGKKADQVVAKLIDGAFSLEDYRKSFFINYARGLRKYKPNVKVDTPYLSEAFRLPESGLICIKSDMATGKTYLLELWRKAHPEEKFLNNGHRVNLLKNLAERLETVMYSAMNSGDLGKADALSITVDSLYKMAGSLQVYGCLFIDEACQYLAHVLKSKTCKEHRGEILEVLECLVYRSKSVVLADAHLDDITIDFFRAMRPEGEEPFIVENNWKSGGRQVFWYGGSNSSALVAQIHVEVMEGKKVIVVADSKRFIKKLERSLMDASSLIPEAEDDSTLEPEVDRKLRIWAIHSENSGSEENVKFIKDITNSVKSVDVLLASPSLGTGVDICGGKGEYHFDAIFGAFHAVSQSATECAQQLWRYRPNVPMHIWVAPRPPFGYLEINPRKIKQKILDRNELTAFLIRIDRETGRRGAEKDWALDVSCQIEAQRNYSINNLKQDLASLLLEMGNEIVSYIGWEDEEAKEWMSVAGEALDREHCLAVAGAKDIDKATYEARQHQDYLNPEEHLECEKYRLHEAYGQEVTAELVERDDGGRYLRKLLALEALLGEPGGKLVDSQGREFDAPPKVVADRDLSERDRLPICTDWRNESAAWLMRHRLGLKDIIVRFINGEEISGTEDFMQQMAEFSVRNASHIKALLGLTIPINQSSNWILSQYLQQLGLFTQCRRHGSKGQQTRLYSLKQEELSFALQVLAYREQRRQERERRRQEERELNTRRIAGLQAQYGFDNSPHLTAGEQTVSSFDTVVNPPLIDSGEYFSGGLTTDSQGFGEVDLESNGEREVINSKYSQADVEAIRDTLSSNEHVPDAETLADLRKCWPVDVLNQACKGLSPERHRQINQWVLFLNHQEREVINFKYSQADVESIRDTLSSNEHVPDAETLADLRKCWPADVLNRACKGLSPERHRQINQWVIFLNHQERLGCQLVS